MDVMDVMDMTDNMEEDTATATFDWCSMERAMKRVLKNHVDGNVKTFLRVVADEYQLEEETLARAWETFAASGTRRVTTAVTTVKKKRGMNAYNLFCKMERSTVLQKYPGTTNKEVMKRLGEEWKLLTDADKEAWKQRRLALDVEDVATQSDIDKTVETRKTPPTSSAESPALPTSPPRPSVLFAETPEDDENDYLRSFLTKLQGKTEEQLRRLCLRYGLPCGSKQDMINAMMSRATGQSP